MGLETIQTFFEASWQQYCGIAPDAALIEAALVARGDRIVNDHVAYRTFDLPGVSRLELGRYFEQEGYERQEDLEFPEKKLRATSWLHRNPLLPKVFISELELARVSPGLREWVLSVTSQARGKELRAEVFFGDNWPRPALADYLRFYPESEYAAWTAAFGIRANHFTVLVNELGSYAGSLARLVSDLRGLGFELNSAGGVIKGSQVEGLEQASTLARRVPWSFSGGESAEIMSCYYEFAQRHELTRGAGLFQGFVPASADRIFESNFERR